MTEGMVMECMGQHPFRLLLVGHAVGNFPSLLHLLEQTTREPYLLESVAGWGDGMARAMEFPWDACVVCSTGEEEDLEPIRRLCHAGTFPVVVRIPMRNRAFSETVLQMGAADCLEAGELTAPLLDRVLTYAADRFRLQRKLTELSDFDLLTGLPNRNLFRERIRQALALAVREGHISALLLLDLDRFDRVNGALGHPAGDLVLKEVSARINECLRNSDTLARFGGDEFAIFLPVLKAPRSAAYVARRILQALSRPILLQGQEIFPSAGIGIAVHPFDGKDLDALLSSAHSAVRQAKSEGGRAFHFYSLAMNADSDDRLFLESRLHRALEKGEFLLHYQPQFEVATGRLRAVEALLRWHPADHPLILPGRFLPLLEESGLIHSVGEWVLRTACAQALKWRDGGMPPFRLSVNLSGRQLRTPGLPDRIRRILAETGFDPGWLELELTESTLMENVQANVEILRQVKNLGVRLAMDDFGKGYSSLSCLRHFPFDTLKIDRSFLAHLPAVPNEETLTGTIIAMGQSLGMTVVAEGVENREQLEFLRRHRCDAAQGYFLGCPMSGEDLNPLLRKAG